MEQQRSTGTRARSRETRIPGAPIPRRSAGKLPRILKLQGNGAPIDVTRRPPSPAKWADLIARHQKALAASEKALDAHSRAENRRCAAKTPAAKDAAERSVQEADKIVNKTSGALIALEVRVLMTPAPDPAIDPVPFNFKLEIWAEEMGLGVGPYALDAGAAFAVMRADIARAIQSKAAKERAHA